MQKNIDLNRETEKAGEIVIDKIRQTAKSESISFEPLTIDPAIEKWANVFIERIYGRESKDRHYMASVVIDEDRIYVHLKIDGLKSSGVLFGLKSLLRGRHATTYEKLAEEISSALKQKYPNAKVVVDKRADYEFGADE